MLVRVWPGLDFWYYLAIISSPSWVSSFLAMDFIKKTSDLVFIFLISTLALSWSASNLLLSMFYFSLRRNPETNRFFRGHECAGKTIGFVLGVLGNVGLYYFSEKSVACILTFLFLAFYCLCALFCIQPYMGFGALEFLLTASLNPTLCRFGLRSPYSWLVIIACIVIEGIRYSLQPQHRPEQATRDEVELVELEAGELPPITYNEDSPHLGSPLDNNHSPSDILFEPAPAGEPTTPLLVPIGSTAERFHALLLKDSGVLYEDPCIQIGVKAKWRAHQGQLVLSLENKNTAPLVSVQALILPPSHLNIELSVVPETIPPRAQMQCPLEVINLHPSRDVAFLDFSYKFGTQEVNVKLRLPALLNKFLQPIPVSAEEFFPQWRSLSGPPLKLQEVVKGVRPMSIPEMENLFNNLRLLVCPGLDPNPNNLVASTTFYSKSTRAMLCLIRIETDPADRTQLRMTVASGDPALTYELKEFVKEQLVYVPTSSGGPAAPLPQAQPSSPPTAISDHAGLLH